MFYLIEDSLLFDILPANNDMTVRIGTPITEDMFQEECSIWNAKFQGITGIAIRKLIIDKIKKFTNTFLPIPDIVSESMNLSGEDRVYIVKPKINDIQKIEFIPVQLTSKFLFDVSKAYTFEEFFKWVDKLYEDFKGILPYFSIPGSLDYSWAIIIDKSNPSHDTIEFRMIDNDEILCERQGEPVAEITHYHDRSISVSVYDEDNESPAWNWQYLKHKSDILVSSDLLESIRAANTGYGMNLMYFLQDVIGPEVIVFTK